MQNRIRLIDTGLNVYKMSNNSRRWPLNSKHANSVFTFLRTQHFILPNFVPLIRHWIKTRNGGRCLPTYVKSATSVHSRQLPRTLYKCYVQIKG